MGYHPPEKKHDPLEDSPIELLNPLKKEIDYSHFDEKFENRPVKIGPEFGTLELQREEYIRNHALSYKKPIEYPMAFGRLDPLKFKKTPSTRIWYQRVSAIERNGFLNMWTMKLNLKLKYWLLYPCLVWGVTATVFEGMYVDEFDFDRDRDIKIYDKLAPRTIPFARVWNRPG